jgi:PAS domain S-box-containing protein
MLNHSLPFANELIQSIEEGIVVIDSDEQITFFNPSAGRIIGWVPDEVLGKPVDVIFPMVEGDKNFLEALESDHSPLFLRIYQHNGQEITISVTNVSLRPADGGDELAWDQAQRVLVFRDVTELDATQQLRSYFLANILHEFRTPLSALKASVEWLLDDVGELSREETASLLNSINFSLTGLQTLIDNLLESMSIEAGRFQIRRRMSDLNALVAEAADTMRPLLDRRKQTLKVNVDPQLSQANIDAMRLTQVLVNLLSNASKYGPMEKPIQLTLVQEGSNIKFSVADQGDGIPPEERKNIFRRFIRLDDRDKPQYGVGLGLSLVKTIVEEHGGNVGLDERPGGGSIFWFTIPIQEGSR